MSKDLPTADTITLHGHANGEQQAFPLPHIYGEGGCFIHEGTPGLTKREEFAKAAMQGICASELYLDLTPEALAKDAVLCADALLKELAK